MLSVLHEANLTCCCKERAAHTLQLAGIEQHISTLIIVLPMDFSSDFANVEETGKVLGCQNQDCVERSFFEGMVPSTDNSLSLTDPTARTHMARQHFLSEVWQRV